MADHEPRECSRCGEPYVAQTWALSADLVAVEGHEGCRAAPTADPRMWPPVPVVPFAGGNEQPHTNHRCATEPVMHGDEADDRKPDA